MKLEIGNESVPSSRQAFSLLEAREEQRQKHTHRSYRLVYLDIVFVSESSYSKRITNSSCYGTNIEMCQS